MADRWTIETLLETTRSYQSACVLVAAAELDLFGALAEGPRSAADLAAAVEGDSRAVSILADALAALGLLSRKDDLYAADADLLPILTEGDPRSALPMIRHQANCLRSWAQLASVVRAGRPADRSPSIRGADEDRRSFIEAMEVASRVAAPKLVAALGPPPFNHLLDIGGGPATWTIAFLKRAPGARATLYDLPEVIPMARRHVEAAGLAERVQFVAGDFLSDEKLPAPVDLAWVSAIIHQNSRGENRRLFAKVRAALDDGGRILIRDMVMDESHTSPPAGALFAVNMLVNTKGGGTFSLAELDEDLRGAGFGPPEIVARGARDMDTVVAAAKA